MMRVRWTMNAAEDMYRITMFIRQDKPQAASQIATAIYEACEGLARFPHLGRKGKEAGTRELVFAPLPYLAVYRVQLQVVEILQIWHGSQER